MIFAVRRIADKEFMGVFDTTMARLFDDIDTFADPYGFEYSVTKFATHTATPENPIEWQQFEWPSKKLSK